jgi:hypothetical protein
VYLAAEFVNLYAIRKLKLIQVLKIWGKEKYPIRAAKFEIFPQKL